MLGIDIGKDQLVVVLLRPGHEAERATFDNRLSGFKALQRFLKKRRIQALHGSYRTLL